MPDNIEKWQIEGYLAVQLLCCFNWRLGRVKGFDEVKLGKFLSGMTPTIKSKLGGLINKVQLEIYSDINRAVHQDLPFFCTMIPPEYRADAWERCKAILRSNTHKADELIYNSLQKGLT